MNRQKIIIHELITWINENITCTMTINDVARRAGYSCWHLQRIFLEITNQKLGQYIREKKLISAATELSTTTLSVMDISLKYGYGSQQSFTRSFCRKYRVPPATYRRLKQKHKKNHSPLH